MSQAIVFTDKTKADTYSVLVDSKLGYPKPGIDIGAGAHVPPAQSVTVRYGDVKQHPTLAQWAYPYDGTVQTEIGKGDAPIPVGAAVQTLDATWTPAPVVTGAAVAVAEVP